jgi:hypothetical protein
VSYDLRLHVVEEWAGCDDGHGHVISFLYRKR